MITSRRLNELERVKNRCKYPENVEILIIDLAEIDEIDSVVNNYFLQNPEKRIDILINNAGLSMRATCLEHTFDQDKYLMNVNFLSYVALTKVFQIILSNYT